MIGSLSKDKKKNTPSAYLPPVEIMALTKEVKDDYANGLEIQQTPYTEFNDETLKERMSLDQKAFNSYSEPKSIDPDRSWQWKGIRPITRNKIISIAAHMTANILVPNVFAQNNADEEDREAGEVMRNLIEWNIKNSDYDITFLGAIIDALTNPAVIVKAEFAEVMQEIRIKNEAGETTVKEVIDEFFSGLKLHIVPCEELLINNIYEYDVQRQKCLLHRRFVSHDEMEGKYGDHKNFKYVKPGTRVFYSEDEGMFYEEKDDTHPTLNEEVIYYNRREDKQIPFVNGVYMGEDDINDNTFKHRRITLTQDKEIVLVPVYPFAKTGYELIDEKRFFYYKSAAFKLQQEQNLVDRIYQMVMDGTFMQVMPPIAGFGTGAIDSSIMYPGAFTAFKNDAKLEKLDNGARLDSGYRAIESIELSMSQSSQNEVAGGGLPDPDQKAYVVARAEQNARIQLGLFGKIIGRLVVDLGYLMCDIILNHQTVASIEETLGGELKLTYRKFLLPEQIKDGKKMTKKIIFDEGLIGRKMTEEQKLEESFKLKEGGGEETEIIRVNPPLFSKYRFLFYVEADQEVPKTRAFEKAWNLEALDRGINNPYIDQEKWTQEHLVEVFHKGDSDRFMQKPQEGMEIPTKLPVNQFMGNKVGATPIEQ